MIKTWEELVEDYYSNLYRGKNVIKIWKELVKDSNLNLYLKIDKENGLMRIVNLDTDVVLKIVKF